MGFRLGDRGNDQESMKLVAEAGLSLGLAFQAVDDLLDVTRTSEELGKDAAHDAESGKVTWVGLLGSKKPGNLLKSTQWMLSNKLTGVGGNNTFVLELANRMLDRKN